MLRTITKRAVAGAALLLIALGSTKAEAPYPSKPIEMIVPFPPAGVTDIIARSLSNELQSISGQPVVVQNKAGATGIVAANYVKNAAPDGYTVMMGSASQMAVLPALKSQLSFDPEKDFVPLAVIGTTPYVLLVNAAVPAKTVPELIALMKQGSKTFNYSTSGIGSMPNLLGEMFKQQAKVDMTHVPYQGNSPATTAAASGEVQITFDSPISALPFVKASQLRALGVAALQPIEALPGVPPIADSLPGFRGESWLALYVPAKTPAAVVDKLRAMIGEAAKRPDFIKNAVAGGFIVPTLTVQQTTDFLHQDTVRWRDVGHAAGITLE